MSYLPHSSSATGTWAVAWGTSGVLHVGLFGLLLSSYIPFLPKLDGQPPQFESFLVSFEIRDASVIQDIEVPNAETPEVFEDSALAPDAALPDTLEEIAAGLEPDASAADAAALAPDLSPSVAPILDLSVAPNTPTAEALAEPVATAPSGAVVFPQVEDAASPEGLTDPATADGATLPVEVDLRAPDVIDGQATPVGTPQASVAPLLEESFAQGQVQPAPTPGEFAAERPADPAPRDDQPLIVDDVSIVDDIDVSPLAEGGLAETPDPVADTSSAPVVQPAPLAPAGGMLAPLASEIAPADAVTGLVTQPSTTAPSAGVVSGGISEPQQPVAENFAALAPSAQAPSDSLAPLAPTAQGQSGLTPNVLQPDAAFDDTGVIGVDATAIASPSVGQIAMGQLLRRIRAVQAPQCTLALPRGVAPDGIGLSLIGARDDVVSQYADRLLERDAPAVLQSREVVDARQCAVLDVVRANEAYPASRIGLNIERTQLRSGDDLRARVIGAGGLNITALLIDDNGVVQDLGRFATVDGTSLVIDAPVARAGDARTTRQILLVLGTRDAPLDLSGQIGNLAQDALPAIDPQALQSALFGLATFEVR